MHQATHRILTVALVALVALSAWAPSQSPAEGLRLFQLRPFGFCLVDPRGAVVHNWPTPRPQNFAVALAEDGSLVHANGNGVTQLEFDGTRRWHFVNPPGFTPHHDIEPLPNGNVLLIVREPKTRAEVLALGRNPTTFNQVVDFGAIIEVQPAGPTKGTIVWEWHVVDHLVQDFAPQQASFAPVANHPELIDVNYPSALLQGTEFNHLNGLDYDPIYDRIVVSSPLHDEVWVIDHSTTTAEAAGHSGGRWGKGGDLLYRWGNPAVYRAGPASAKMLDWQHDPQFVAAGYPGAGNLTVFNNSLSTLQSEAIELKLPLDPAGNFILTAGGAYGPAQPAWTYRAPGFFSTVMSSAQRLPNGNTLICSAQQGWVFEVTPTGQRVWEQRSTTGFLMFHAHHTQRSLWADRESLSATAGGTVQFDLQAGSARAGDVYALLGSASGTSPGFTLHGVSTPLNPDDYFYALLGMVGSGIFSSWLGTLDALGSGQASLALPPLPHAAGVSVHHAMAVIGSTTNQLTLASNPVPLTLAR